MLVCFSDNNKNGLLCGKVDFLHCVCCDSCHHRPFPSQRQQKAGQSSPNLHPRDFSRLLAFKYLFHHYKTVFPKKKATALFCFDFWNDFADMKWGKNKHTQFCSPPRSQRLMVWLLTWNLLSKMAKSFPSLSSRDLSFFQEEAQPGGIFWRFLKSANCSFQTFKLSSIGWLCCLYIYCA